MEIGADGGKRDELLQSSLAPHLHELRAHHEVIVEEPACIGLVRADTSDPRSQMQDDIRGCVIIEPPHSVHLDQVIILTSRHPDIPATLLAQLCDDD